MKNSNIERKSPRPQPASTACLLFPDIGIYRQGHCPTSGGVVERAMMIERTVAKQSGGLADVFGELFAQRGVGRVAPPAGTRTFIRDVTTGETKQLPSSLPEPEEIVISAKKTPQSVEKEKLLNVFTINGETIELADNRLKAKSAADYYKRLTYLFIYAKDLLLGHTLAPKNELIVVLKEAKVYDANCRFWLKQKRGFTVDSEERMKLIAGAREQAVKALDEILDSNLLDEWNPDTKSAKPRAAKKKASK